MLLFYRIGLLFYRFALLLASVSNQKAKQWRKGRKGLFKRLKADFANRNSNEPVLWIHCASLGEFEQGRPIIEAAKRQFPTLQILLTFFSPSGYEIRKDYQKADWVYYLPIDSPQHARRFIDIVNPTLSIFVKYEFWYFYLQELINRQIPVFSVSTILRESQAYFSAKGQFFLPVLRGINHYFVQNESTKMLLSSIGIDQATVSGDTRFDRVVEMADSCTSMADIEAFVAGARVFVLGSTWEQDIDLFEGLINRDDRDVKYIVAPHEVSKSKLKALKTRFASHAIYHSEWKDDKGKKDSSVLIIDSVGLLSAIYRYATYVYVGGGFGKGLHNTLEAAVFGKPIFIAPSYEKFQEAVDLVRHGAIFPVSSASDIALQVQKFEDNPDYYAQTCSKARNYVLENAGATPKIIDYCKTWIAS